MHDTWGKHGEKLGMAIRITRGFISTVRSKIIFAATKPVVKLFLFAAFPASSTGFSRILFSSCASVIHCLLHSFHSPYYYHHQIKLKKGSNN